MRFDAHAHSRFPRGWIGCASALWLLSTIVLPAGFASATVVVDANVDGVYTDLSFTTPTSAVIVDGDSTGGLAVGNGVVIRVDVANPDAHDVQALFLTLTVDPSQLDYVGGTVEPRILVAPNPFGINFLGSLVNAPEFKADDATFFTMTAVSHADPFGTTGQGPDVATALLQFEVFDASSTIQVDLSIGSGNGLLIDDIVVDDANVASNPDLVRIDSATLYVPEPSGSTLLAAGLFGLAAMCRQRRQSLVPRSFGVLALAAALAASLLLVGRPVSAVDDIDNDLVPDQFDNCLLIPNGPLQSNQQADTDQDGFGDACDADYDQDGYVLGLDVIFWLQNCWGTFNIAQCDLRANGTGGDPLTYGTLVERFNREIGPSGLSCATIPPVSPCLP